MARVVSIERQRDGEYSLLQFAPPGGAMHNAGVLLLDRSSGRAEVKFREDWDEIAAPEDAEVLGELQRDCEQKISEMGGMGFRAWLEDSLSHSLLITGRSTVALDSFARVLDRLYEQHVGRLEVEPFRTHLPLYTLAAAATKFGEDAPADEEEWVRAPARLRLNDKMFVAHVTGRSMEPLIPDGSLNVFRYGIVGSRQNKIVLVERAGVLDTTARYSIKKYASTKTYEGDEWRHQAIRMEPVNPEFEAFELQEGDRILAEWLQVLD